MGTRRRHKHSNRKTHHSDAQRFSRGEITAMVILVLTGLIMLKWTWKKWPDVLIDSGQQLYVAWQLSEGSVLYRDISWYNGPLSQYWNALWMFVFGDNINSLMSANLFLLSIFLVVLYCVFVRVGGRLASIAACLFFVLQFAFAEFSVIGNYNYVCPYSHEVTHGVLLSLIGLYLSWLWLSDRWWVRLSCGFAVGLVFLTKAEVFLGCAIAVATSITLTVRLSTDAQRNLPRDLLFFFGGFFAPIVMAFAALSTQVPWRDAASGVVGSWAVVFHPEVKKLAFFQQTLGTDDLPKNLTLAAVYFCVVIATVWSVTAIALRVTNESRRRTLFVTATLILSTIVVVLTFAFVPWQLLPRAMPLLIVAAIVGTVVKCRSDAGATDLFIRRISLLVLGLGLLAKMLFAVRISNYGFTLAMPATLTLVVVALDWIPAELSRRHRCGAIVQAAMIPVLLAFIGYGLLLQAHHMSRKTVHLLVGNDSFWADDRANPLQQCARDLRESTSPETTLAVIPDGIMLNYLSRRRSPTTFTNYMPTEVLYFGVDQAVKNFQHDPPDLVAMIPRGTEEFGAGTFEEGYGAPIMQWIHANYRIKKEYTLDGQPNSPAFITLLEYVDR